MGRWYLGQLASGATLEDTMFLDLEMPGDADGSGGGLVVFRHPGLEHYQRLIEAARSRLADLELDYGVEKSKVDSVRSRVFGALRPYYQKRDRLRLLIQYRKAFIDRLLAGGEEAADAHELPMSECEALSIGIPWAGRIGVSPLLAMWSADFKERRTPSPPMPMWCQ